MKKIIYSLIITIIAMATSCSSQQPLAVTSNGENPMTFSVEGKNITVNLIGNATTGYTWACTIKNESKLKVTKDEYAVPQNEDGKVILGQPGVHTFQIEAAEKGKTTVVFDYGQHWEKGKSGGIRTLEVKIDENLNVTANEKE